MNRSEQWAGVPALIDQLIETADARHRDRILLEAVAAQRWVDAAALWRPGSDGPEFGARWHQVLARGPAEHLPEREAVHAVVRGECAGDVLPGLLLLHAGEGCNAFVLAIASEDAPEEDRDLLEALICLFATVDADRGDDEVDLWAPLAPGDDSARIEHDLRNLLTGIQATQELLASYGDDLSDDETRHFSELIDRECTRAGDLLGSALAGADELASSCRPAALLRDLIADRTNGASPTLRLEVDDDCLHVTTSLDEGPCRDALAAWLRSWLPTAGDARLHLCRLGASEMQLRVTEHAPRLHTDARTGPAAPPSTGFEAESMQGGWCLRFPPAGAR